MTPLLKKRIEQGRLILFLGAGSSVGCHTLACKPAAPLSSILKTELIDLAALDDADDDDLQDVFRAVQKIVPRQLQEHLEAQYGKLVPSRQLQALSKYPWARIYTTNIDDALYGALVKNSNQKVTARSRTSSAAPISSSLQDLDLIFLNGYVNRPHESYIFTAMEYARAQAANLPWFRQLVRDFFEYTFLFVGTRLKEPTLNFHIATHSQTTSSALGRSYLLLPSISSAQRETLADLNVEFLQGSLDDLTKWLEDEFPNGLSRDQVLEARTPVLSFFKAHKPSESDLAAFENLVIVSRSHLPAPDSAIKRNSSTIDFYKGFKPSWFDILSSIPAELEVLSEILDLCAPRENRFIVLYGPMGSGKTTSLMQVALRLSDAGSSVYFINEQTDNLHAIVETLEKAHDHYFLFIDRVAKFDRQLRRCFSDDLIRSGQIVCGERENVWLNQAHELLSEFDPITLRQHEITAKDADAILDKISDYAPAVGFTGLGRRERKKLLLEHSRKQLLIGLLVATYGPGYRRMIVSEYEGLQPDAQSCFLLVGLATHHDIPAPRSLVELMLRETYGINHPLSSLLEHLTGIVRVDRDRLYARHPAYVDEIFRSRVVREGSEQALVALMSYFSTLPVPISSHRHRLGGAMVELFKKTVNHSFVSFLLKEPSRVLSFYSEFEKAFSNDGLFWLQMGLAYRCVGKHEEALDAFESAIRAYPMTHTHHALAQQKLILASRLALTGEASKARAFLDEGIAALKNLDSLDDLVGGRYYPIVALSEGHVFVTKTLDGEEQAKRLAQEYAQVITQRLNREGAVFRGTIAQRLSAPQVRAKATLKRLNGFVFNGRWAFGNDLASIMTTDLPDSKVS